MQTLQVTRKPVASRDELSGTFSNSWRERRSAARIQAERSNDVHRCAEPLHGPLRRACCLNTYAQHPVFFAGVAGADPHPHPEPPADFTSASRAQQAFVPLGAGPPQHAFAGEACSTIRWLSAICCGAVSSVLVLLAIVALLVSGGDCIRRAPEKTAAAAEGRRSPASSHAAWSSAA